MYIPKAFEVEDREVALEFMRRHGFATMVTSAEGRIEATHAPVIVKADEASVSLFAHFAKANDHWRHFDGEREALVIFQGPHGYVSPSLYETLPAVPTWNYQMVHAHGVPTVIESVDETRAHVLELVRVHEGSQSQPWRPSFRMASSKTCSARSWRSVSM